MKRLNSQKGMSPIIAVVVLAVILIGGGTYYFRQLTDATANWKTYTNTQYGFSIKYPQGWAEVKPFDPTYGVILRNSDEKSKSDYWLSIIVMNSFSKNNEGGKNLNNWFAEVRKVDEKNINFKEVSIAGQKAFRTTSNPTTQSPGGIVYDFAKGNEGYAIQALYVKQSDGTGEKMLSTLKFTNQNQASSPSPSADSSDQAVKTFYNTILDCEHAFGDVAIHTYNSTEIDQAGQVRDGCNKNANNRYLIAGSLISSNIFCAQNIPQSLTFDKAIVSPDGKASVAVHTIWGGNAPRNINVGLQEVNNQWKIASIDCNK